MKTLYSITLSLTLLYLASSVSAQQIESGIKFYNQGDFERAITLLKNSDEVEDIFYLGLAYEKINETSKAKDAFKKSFAESYDIFFGRFNEWQKADQFGTKKSFFDLLEEVKTNNQIGLSAAEKAFSLKSDIFQTNEWRIKAKVLLDTTTLAKAQDKIYAFSDKSISDAKIIQKPFITSPNDNRGVPFARRNQSPNKPIIVTTFIVFGADGKIKLLMPTEDMIDAYTVEVLKGIEKIKFKTASKDNKSVAYHAKIQYSFSIR